MQIVLKPIVVMVLMVVPLVLHLELHVQVVLQIVIIRNLYVLQIVLKPIVAMALDRQVLLAVRLAILDFHVQLVRQTVITVQQRV